MSKRNDKFLALDILESINKIQSYIRGFNYRKFVKDEKTIDAVVRNLEIIGEASKHLSKQLKENSSIPWKRIIGLRNVIVHEYFGIDKKIVWTIITKQLKSLKTQIEKLVIKIDN
jgi:uncharacterized protein with HEPN domain